MRHQLHCLVVDAFEDIDGGDIGGAAHARQNTPGGGGGGGGGTYHSPRTTYHSLLATYNARPDERGGGDPGDACPHGHESKVEEGRRDPTAKGEAHTCE